MSGAPLNNKLDGMHMQWSKLKAQLKERLAPSLAGRLDVHSARYRHLHDQLGRVWFTLDKKEILQLSDPKFEWEYYGLAYDVREMNKDISVHEAYDHARAVTSAKGNFARFDFGSAANEFLNSSIESSLASENPLLRALAVIDRRVGKRKLAELVRGVDLENPVVQILLRVRCESEGITAKDQKSGTSSAV